MKWQCLLLAGAWIALAVPAHAEFYKYRDANGVTRYTDNLVEVPVDQRPGVNRYKEADDDLTPEERAKRAAARAAAERTQQEKLAAVAEKRAAEQAAAAEDAVAISSAAELNRRNNELFEAYQALDRERQALKQAGAKVRTRTASNAYNEKVQALNKRFEAYKRRQAAFQKQVDAFNAKEQALSAGTEKKKN